MIALARSFVLLLSVVSLATSVPLPRDPAAARRQTAAAALGQASASFPTPPPLPSSSALQPASSALGEDSDAVAATSDAAPTEELNWVSGDEPEDAEAADANQMYDAQSFISTADNSTAAPEPCDMVLMDKNDVQALLTTIKAQQSLVAVSQPAVDDGQYHPGTKGAWQAAAVVPAANATSSDASTTAYADDASTSDADSTTAASERRSLFRTSKGEASTRQAALARGASNEASSSAAASQGQKARRSLRVFVSGAQPKRRSLIVAGSNGAMIDLVGGDMASIEASIAGHRNVIQIRSHRDNRYNRNDRHRHSGSRYSDHDHEHAHIHEHDHSHRRRQEKALTGLVGQLGVLQPLSGAMEGTGLSQLVANLILAPLSAVGKATSFAATNGTADDSVNATAPAPASSFLLAPSTSASGVKLQLIEIPEGPEAPAPTDPDFAAWLQVELQATLAASNNNEPHLYCATIRKPASLRMEMCDDQMTATTASGAAPDSVDASRRFLYNPETGEVVPYAVADVAPAPAAAAAAPSSVASAAASASTPAPLARSMGAANLAVSKEATAIKLVFFADETTKDPAMTSTDDTESSMTNEADSMSDSVPSPSTEASDAAMVAGAPVAAAVAPTSIAQAAPTALPDTPLLGAAPAPSAAPVAPVASAVANAPTPALGDARWGAAGPAEATSSFVPDAASTSEDDAPDADAEPTPTSAAATASSTSSAVDAEATPSVPVLPAVPETTLFPSPAIGSPVDAAATPVSTIVAAAAAMSGNADTPAE